MANASFGLGESPFIFASVCKCEGVQRIFGSITKGAPALHKLYTRERHFSLNLSRGDSPSADGGNVAAPATGECGARRGGKKEGQPAVFLPLWTPTFPLDSLAQIADM